MELVSDSIRTLGTVSRVGKNSDVIERSACFVRAYAEHLKRVAQHQELYARRQGPSMRGDYARTKKKGLTWGTLTFPGIFAMF